MMLRIEDNLERFTGEELARLIDSLPAWRREQALRFSHEQGRRECAVAYHLLRNMLEEGFGITDEQTFVYGEHGKPELKDHPDLHFSISHCRQAVACVISERPVGIDVESKGRFRESVARYMLSDDELARVMQSPRREEEFTRLWTRKEAVLKLSGEGINDNMKSVLQRADEQQVTLTTVEKDTYIYSIAQ